MRMRILERRVGGHLFARRSSRRRRLWGRRRRRHRSIRSSSRSRSRLRACFLDRSVGSRQSSSRRLLPRLRRLRLGTLGFADKLEIIVPLVFRRGCSLRRLPRHRPIVSLGPVEAKCQLSFLPPGTRQRSASHETGDPSPRWEWGQREEAVRGGVERGAYRQAACLIGASAGRPCYEDPAPVERPGEPSWMAYRRPHRQTDSRDARRIKAEVPGAGVAVVGRRSRRTDRVPESDRSRARAGL